MKKIEESETNEDSTNEAAARVEEAPGEVGRGCRLMWEGRGSALMSSCVSRGLRKPGSGPCGEEHSRHREQQVSEALRQEASVAGAE